MRLRQKAIPPQVNEIPPQKSSNRCAIYYFQRATFPLPEKLRVHHPILRWHGRKALIVSLVDQKLGR